VRYRYRAHSGI